MAKKEKRILIAGGAGFIGSHVNKLLHQQGYQTIVYDNLSRGSRLTVREGDFIEGDISDENKLGEIFQAYSIDAVMHFAAFIDVGESVREPINYYLNNVAHTVPLLSAMIKHNVKHFVFSSSAGIFGHPQEKLITEDHPCQPISPYGESKWMVEKMLRDLESAYGLKSCCFRYFNAAGGDPDKEIKNHQKQMTNLIPLTLRSIKTGRPLTIFGTDYPTPDGTCIRDYVHVYDLGMAHISGMEKLFASPSSLYYNLGNGRGYSIREVIEAAEKVTGHQVPFIEGPRRPGDTPILLADSTKAQRELHWFVRYPSLETMIEHAWIAMNP